MHYDENALYHLLSFGREPNETHLGLSSSRSCGRGTSPEIVLPIIREMLRKRLFNSGLITELSDLQLWTPNFGPDRLSDLTTNIIRGVLYDFTLEQYEALWIPRSDESQIQVAWNPQSHRWEQHAFPKLCANRHQVLLVPKDFVGRNMLSSPGELLQKYALSYRQKEHLDERSHLCRRRTDKYGRETWTPPTKKELRQIEVIGQSEKEYMLRLGYRHPQMVRELHVDNRHSSCFMSDEDLDYLLYFQRDNVI